MCRFGTCRFATLFAFLFCSFSSIAYSGDPANHAKVLREAGKVVFITNADSPFWDAAEKGANDAGAELKRSVTFNRNRNGDAAGQIRLLDRALTDSDIKGVVVSINSTTAGGIIDRLKKLKENGVQVLTFDSDTAEKDKTTRVAYVGTNNVEAGKTAGKVAKMLSPEGGKVVAFVGIAKAENARQRIDGFKEGAGEKFQVAEIMEDGTDRSKARQNVVAALLKYDDLRIPFGIWSYNAPVIAQSVEESGKRDKLKIVTFDAEAATMKAVRTGKIDATIVQNTYDMGYQSVALLNALISGDNAKKKELLKEGDQIDTGVRVIVPDDSPLKGKEIFIQTHSEFEAWMKSKGLKST